MAQPTGERPKSLPTLASELWALIVDYLKQEALDPLRGLGRFAGFGLAGALVLGTGLVVMMLGLLRLLETHTGSKFAGNLSWAPYGITAAACLVLVGLAMAVRARKPSRSASRGS